MIIPGSWTFAVEASTGVTNVWPVVPTAPVGASCTVCGLCAGGAVAMVPEDTAPVESVC